MDFAETCVYSLMLSSTSCLVNLMLLCGYFLALTLSLISVIFDSTRRFMIVHFLYKAVNIAEHLPLVNLLQLCLLVDEALLLLLQNHVALGHAFQHRRFN